MRNLDAAFTQVKRVITVSTGARLCFLRNECEDESKKMKLSIFDFAFIKRVINVTWSISCVLLPLLLVTSLCIFFFVGTSFSLPIFVPLSERGTTPTPHLLSLDRTRTEMKMMSPLFSFNTRVDHYN